MQGYIARNSFRNGDWEEEEDYGDLPIYQGQQFEILILCEPTQFKVSFFIFPTQIFCRENNVKEV